MFLPAASGNSNIHNSRDSITATVTAGSRELKTENLCASSVSAVDPPLGARDHFSKASTAVDIPASSWECHYCLYVCKQSSIPACPVCGTPRATVCETSADKNSTTVTVASACSSRLSSNSSHVPIRKTETCKVKNDAVSKSNIQQLAVAVQQRLKAVEQLRRAPSGSSYFDCIIY